MQALKLRSHKAVIMTAIHVIDVSNWLHRAYHAGPQLTSPSGYPTGAVKVFLNMVDSLRRKLSPNDYLVFAFDCPRDKSWRYELVQDWCKTNRVGSDGLYKAGRKDDPEKRESLSKQMKLVRTLLDAAGFCLLVQDASEADDILATIARRFHHVCNVHLHTRDKDCASMLVYPNVCVEHPAADRSPARTLAGSEDCVKVYGVRPEQIVDFLTLMGDKADNIPGVPGVGEQTAVKILTAFDSIANFMSQEKECSRYKSFRDKNFPMPIELMQELITLNTRVAGVPTQLKKLARKPITQKRTDELLRLKRKYAFSSLFGA